MDSAHHTGRCWVLNAFDIGRGISLTACRAALAGTQEVAEGRRRLWPRLFGLQQRPLLWTGEPTEVALNGARVPVQPRAVLYDFGSVSISFGLELGGELARWRDMSAALAERSPFDQLARDTLESLMRRFESAVVQPAVSAQFEQYTVFQLDRVPGGVAADWLQGNAAVIAQILRADLARLSADEVAESLARRISYTVDDVVVVDWAAALLIDERYEDTLAVLDFANTERLTMAVLDEQLDDAMDSANDIVRSRGWRWPMMLQPYGREIRKLTELTAAAAAEFEAVENAIKLTADDYLARIYRHAADRFHLAPFYESISRKLQTLWNIHQVFIERASNRRSELLEWIIIILIAVELLQFFH
jgi:hypothetical protein